LHMDAFIGAEVDVGDERLTIVLIEPQELHSDLPHLVGGDLDADWFHRRDRPVGRVRGRRPRDRTEGRSL
jgi:hypothetical protein